MKKQQKKIEHDKKILKIFISTYCKNHHLKNGIGIYKNNLCKDCYELLDYAYTKLNNCPLEPKPMCKKCHIHCYSKQNREKIKEIMKFSGIYLIKHGRLDLLFHYYF